MLGWGDQGLVCGGRVWARGLRGRVRVRWRKGNCLMATSSTADDYWTLGRLCLRCEMGCCLGGLHIKMHSSSVIIFDLWWCDIFLH